VLTAIDADAQSTSRVPVQVFQLHREKSMLQNRRISTKESQQAIVSLI
jgi:hypothetical protein